MFDLVGIGVMLKKKKEIIIGYLKGLRTRKKVKRNTIVICAPCK